MSSDLQSPKRGRARAALLQTTVGHQACCQGALLLCHRCEGVESGLTCRVAAKICRSAPPNKAGRDSSSRDHPRRRTDSNSHIARSFVMESAHSSLVARRLRQHPHEFGRAASYVESISLPEIEELSERFLKRINYYGLVEVEYKLDPRDGQYKLLDVNARIWGFHSIGFPAGVDFPYLLFADQLGEQTTRCRGEAGIGWLRLVTDVPTAFSQIIRRQTDARSYFSSLKRTRVESVFCREDPLPSIAEVALLPYLIAMKYR